MLRLIAITATAVALVHPAAVVGLDKELPEAVCQQIMDEKMLPLLKAGDLGGAIEAGVDALVGRLSK